MHVLATYFHGMPAGLHGLSAIIPMAFLFVVIFVAGGLYLRSVRRTS